MKLTGLTVLDISLTQAGARVSSILADHGAEVLVVRSCNSKDSRQSAGETRDEGPATRFRNLARGKRLVRLDLKATQDQTWLMSCATSVDIIVSATANDNMDSDKRGDDIGLDYILDYEAIKKINPSLIYCSLTPYGKAGYSSHIETKTARRFYKDLDIQAATGILAMTRGAGQAPAQPNLPYADIAGAMTASSAILMALYRREQTGLGDQLDIALFDSLLSWAEPNMDIFDANKGALSAGNNAMTQGAFARIYQVKGGDYIVLTETCPKTCKKFLETVGRDDLSEYVEHVDEHEQLISFFKDIFLRKRIKEWGVFLDDLCLSWSPLRDFKDVCEDPHTLSRGIILKDKQGYQHMGTAIHFLHEPAILNFDEPENGQVNIKDLNDKKWNGEG